jgi:hypothetical protein
LELPEALTQPAERQQEACSRSAEPVAVSLTERSIAVEALEPQPERPSPALLVFQPARRVLPAAVVERPDASALLAEQRLPALCR